MKLVEQLHKVAAHREQSDWIAWFKTDDGFYIKVQIDYQATEERAKEIVTELTMLLQSADSHRA
jgi:hypothetical protein